MSQFLDNLNIVSKPGISGALVVDSTLQSGGSSSIFNTTILVGSPAAYHDIVYLNATNNESTAFMRGFFSSVTGANSIAAQFVNNTTGAGLTLANQNGNAIEIGTGNIFLPNDTSIVQGQGFTYDGRTKIKISDSYTLKTGLVVDGNATSGNSYGVYSKIYGFSSGNNIAGYFSAANSSNNYGLIVEQGLVSLGTTSQLSSLQDYFVNVNGNIAFKGDLLMVANNEPTYLHHFRTFEYLNNGYIHTGRFSTIGSSLMLACDHPKPYITWDDTRAGGTSTGWTTLFGPQATVDQLITGLEAGGLALRTNFKTFGISTDNGDTLSVFVSTGGELMLNSLVGSGDRSVIVDSTGRLVAGSPVTGLPGASKYTETASSLTANTIYTVTHGMGTTAIQITLWDVATDEMLLGFTANNRTTSTVDITVTVTGTYDIVIIG